MIADLPLLRHRLIQRILRVWRTKQRLNTQQNSPDLQRRRPVVLQHIQADSAQAIDVRVVYAGQEAYSRRAHRVVVGEEELELEDAACERRSATYVHQLRPDAASLCSMRTLVAASTRSIHRHIEVSCVLIMWLR